MNFKRQPIWVIGDGKLASSICVCLLNAQHPVFLYTRKKDSAQQTIQMHFSDLREHLQEIESSESPQIVDHLRGPINARLAIIVNQEDLTSKRSAIREMERVLPAEALIAINTESIALSAIQSEAMHPERIIGVNWVEPAHTTFFLEIISNETNRTEYIEDFFSVAKAFWKKDPYILKSDFGIRARMMSAMVREAFFLLENEYVSVEDVDRACRNDAGYYLPFAGHCRYMDLMGTYIYGKVMEDLNPELSKETRLPGFFTQIIEKGGEGMENGNGFYHYEDRDVENRVEEFRKFSYEIKDIMSRYPFRSKREPRLVKKEISSDL
jgi:3-hydroxybutyryl-CoA dehydrogenase